MINNLIYRNLVLAGLAIFVMLVFCLIFSFTLKSRDLPLFKKRQHDLEQEMIEGSYNLHVLDIIADAKGKQSVFHLVKNETVKYENVPIIVSSLPLPKEGYFLMKADLFLGKQIVNVKAEAFRSKKAIDISFPLTFILNNKTQFIRAKVIGYIEIN